MAAGQRVLLGAGAQVEPAVGSRREVPSACGPTEIAGMMTRRWAKARPSKPE